MFDAMIQRLLDLAYAAGAAGKFALETTAFRDSYLQLHRLYQDVSATRQKIEAEGSAVLPDSVSRVIVGVTWGAAQAQVNVATSEGTALSQHLRTLEAELSELLTGMHDAYASTLDTDQGAAAGIARAGR